MKKIIDSLLNAAIFSGLFLVIYKKIFPSHFLSLPMAIKILIFILNCLSWLLMTFLTEKLKEYIKRNNKNNK